MLVMALGRIREKQRENYRSLVKTVKVYKYNAKSIFNKELDIMGFGFHFSHVVAMAILTLFFSSSFVILGAP
jgi:DNA polymerase III alpha subunit